MRIGFLGGDARMRACAEGALQKGHSVASLSSFGEGVCVPSIQELCAFCELLVLPSPASRDGTLIAGTDIPFSRLPLSSHHAVFGGFMPKSWKTKGGYLYDCAESESFLLQNAALTADGAIATALSASGRAFFGTSIAVLGYGRIAKLLCARLRGFGVPVTVYARRAEARSEARLYGLHAKPLSSHTVFSEEMIFNTVPEPVFEGTSAPSARCAYDLGGGLPAVLPSPNGEGVRVVSMRGVPGVFAPTAAGEIILEELLRYIDHLASAP